MLSPISHLLAFKIFKHQIFTDVTWLLPKLNFKGPYPAVSICACLPLKLAPCICNENEPSSFCGYSSAFLCFPFITMIYNNIVSIINPDCSQWEFGMVLRCSTAS